MTSVATAGRVWSGEVGDVARRLGVDPARGLSGVDAADRLARIGPNRLAAAPQVPAWRKILLQFRDPLVILLLVAVVISFVVWLVEGAEGMPYEAVVIGVIVVANAVLGYVQEARAEQAVAALQRMATPTATVLRDGVERAIPSEEVVPGDVLLLAEGNAVSADGRLLDAASLMVAEAALTGESEAVLKHPAPLEDRDIPLGDRANMVYSGTAVTRGRGRAVVTSTGMATEMGRIADLLESTEEDPTPLQQEIDRVGRWLGIAVLVIAAVVVTAIVATSGVDDLSDVVDILLVGVSLAVAAVPEGLPAVLSVVLAIGVQRMARRNAIVKKLSSVETLGSASVICTDKTGTLTRNEMTVQKVVTASGEIDVTGTGYEPEGAFLVDGRPLDSGSLLEEVRAVLAGGSLASDASLRREDGHWVISGDPTEVAFLVAERKAGIADQRRDRFARVGEVPFTSERKMMSTFQSDTAHEGRVAMLTKGAPDVLVARCTREQVGTASRPLSDERRTQILATVDRLADQALRTLGVAYRLLPAAPDEPGEDLEHELVFAGIVGIIDPPRPEARVAIADAHRAGIRIVMITGDHPRTAARIAEELGILAPGGQALTGADLDRLDDRPQIARQTAVYARVAPEHKLDIVDALQADGNIVAMTGDGVNDAPALKSADIGVAMGITGTDVTKEAAKMILADDNFATIVTAVREGRGIFANIRKFLRYLLSSNAGEVLTMFFGVIGAGLIGLDVGGDALAVPLLATQILWINLLTDTAPALAMGVDPPPDDVMGRPPRKMSDRIIDGEMQRGVLFVGAVMAVATLLALDIGLPGGLVEGSGEIAHGRTLAFTTLVIAQLFNCFNARSEHTSAFHHLFTNPLLWGAIALSLMLQIVVVHIPVLNAAFGTTPLDPAGWALCLALGSSVLWADELRKVVKRRGDQPSPPAGPSAS